jgi:hypothetical protein
MEESERLWIPNKIERQKQIVKEELVELVEALLRKPAEATIKKCFEGPDIRDIELDYYLAKHYYCNLQLMFDSDNQKYRRLVLKTARERDRIEVELGIPIENNREY